MSTTLRKTDTGLRAAAEALHDAELAMGKHDDRAAHEALLALARASYQSLASFEIHSVRSTPPASALLDRLATWRQELEEMRVQLALAEMEAREAGAELVRTLEPVLEPATGRVTHAVKDIAAALADVRRGLTDRSS